MARRGIPRGGPRPRGGADVEEEGRVELVSTVSVSWSRRKGGRRAAAPSAPRRGGTTLSRRAPSRRPRRPRALGRGLPARLADPEEDGLAPRCRCAATRALASQNLGGQDTGDSPSLQHACAREQCPRGTHPRLVRARLHPSSKMSHRVDNDRDTRLENAGHVPPLPPREAEPGRTAGALGRSFRLIFGRGAASKVGRPSRRG